MSKKKRNRKQSKTICVKQGYSSETKLTMKNRKKKSKKCKNKEKNKKVLLLLGLFGHFSIEAFKQTDTYKSILDFVYQLMTAIGL